MHLSLSKRAISLRFQGRTHLQFGSVLICQKIAYDTLDSVKVFWIAVTALVLINAVLFVALWPTVPYEMADFRQLYTAGYMLRTGHAYQLYDSDAQRDFQNLLKYSPQPLPFNHLAFEAALFAPLSLLPYKTAFELLCVIDLLLLISAWALSRAYDLHFGLTTALVGANAAVVSTMLEGQDSVLLLTAFSLASLCYERRKDFCAGTLIGASCFKPQFALLAGLVLLLWRRWKIVLGIVVSMLALISVSVLIVGWHGILQFGGIAAEMASGETGRYFILPGYMANIRGIVHGLTHGHLVAPITILVSVAFLGWVMLQKPSLGLATLAAVLASYHAFIVDMALLSVPMLTILRRITRREVEPSGASAWIIATLAGLETLFLVHLNYPLFVAATVLNWLCVTSGPAAARSLRHSGYCVNLPEDR